MNTATASRPHISAPPPGSAARPAIRIADDEGVQHPHDTLIERGEAILTERLANFARLTPIERMHLARARDRIGVLTMVDPHKSLQATRQLHEDLERLESLMFVASLQRLSPADSQAVRLAAIARRYSQRTNTSERGADPSFARSLEDRPRCRA